MRRFKESKDLGMEQYEDGFETFLASVEKDAEWCAIYSYTGAAIDFAIGRYPEVHDRLNLNPYFWNALIASLQLSAIISLGRLFDDKPGTFSIRELLDYAETYLGIFSRDALEKRKVKAGLTPDEAKRYVVNVFEPQRNSFTNLRGALDRHRTFYRENVGPIRHKVFAHAARITSVERAELFKDVGKRPLEDLLVFPLRLHFALSRLYQDGREPILPNDVPALVTEIVGNLPERNTSTWEHRHAVKEALDFLLRFRLQGEDDDSQSAAKQ
jgi:hypothetical protein